MQSFFGFKNHVLLVSIHYELYAPATVLWLSFNLWYIT